MRRLCGINYLPPVKVASFKGVNKSLRRGNICAYRNIMNIAEPEQIAFVRLMSLGRKRVSEKEEQIYFIAGDTRAYLLRSALGAAQIPLYGESRSLFYHFPRRTRSAEIVS